MPVKKDDYTVRKLHQMVNARKEMNLTMEEWYIMVDGTLFANCKGCKNDRNKRWKNGTSW